jgi:hypothetical protein
LLALDQLDLVRGYEGEERVLRLEQIQKNAVISGLEPGQVVRIVTTEPVGLCDNYSALTGC